MNNAVDLSTQYLGFTLKSPVIASSSDFTNDVDKMAELEKAGVGAVVLKSIFEEQIWAETDSYRLNNMSGSYGYAEDYIAYYTKQHRLDEYLQLLRTAKGKLNIPVVASVHCSTDNGWIQFVNEIEKAGADAVELNVFILPADANQTEQEIRSRYFSIIEKVRTNTQLPVAVKLHYYFTDMAAFAREISQKVNGLVLFNRFFQPDIDLRTMEVTSAGSLSSPADNYQVLRWVGLLSGQVRASLVASGGIHDADALIKNILAGADASQVASVLYLDGYGAIRKMLAGLQAFMESKGFKSVREMKGLIAFEQKQNSAFERVQFMKYFSDFKQ